MSGYDVRPESTSLSSRLSIAWPCVISTMRASRTQGALESLESQMSLMRCTMSAVFAPMLYLHICACTCALRASIFYAMLTSAARTLHWPAVRSQFGCPWRHRGGAASQLRELIAAVMLSYVCMRLRTLRACRFAHNEYRIFAPDSYCDSELVVDDPEESATGSG